MVEKNLEYLSRQIKFTGFGEDHEEELKQKMERLLPEFQITHDAGFGTDLLEATLNFRKSTESGMYFFNSYHATLKKGHQPSPVEHTFYVNSRENSITLKEAYNLLSGRCVYKEFTAKAGNKYRAWLQMDFKQTDLHGNYKLRQYHQNYGFDLLTTLSRHPIKELMDEASTKRLLESLQKGNRQVITLDMKGQEQRVYIEAVPQFKSLNFYDSSLQRLKTDRLYEQDIPLTPAPQWNEDRLRAPLQVHGDPSGMTSEEKNYSRNKISIS
ncbi:MAG: hypothetical protein KGM98_00855 [Bacteroidota bacterium]|nr:hypothetical protein [Bacteroidota bacterium]